MKTFIKQKLVWKTTTFFLLCIVEITAICNNTFRPTHKGLPHTSIHFLWRIFVKGKTKKIQRKLKNLLPRMLDFAECWEPRIFLFNTSPLSVFVVIYMARKMNRENPNIWKYPNIRRGKTYLTSLWLLKIKKCSNVVLQMKIRIHWS